MEYNYGEVGYVVEFIEAPDYKTVYDDFQRTPMSQDALIIEDEGGYIVIECYGNIELAFVVVDWFNGQNPNLEPFVVSRQLVWRKGE